MDDLALILSVAGIHLVALISPGPDFFMALRNSLTYSRKTGIFTAIGFGLGIGVHISYSLIGLALLISKSPMLFNIIKYLGAIYLLYLGVQSLREKTHIIHTSEIDKQQDISPLKAIGIGFLTNVLNPKATLFFLSLFTLVITPDIARSTMIIISIILIGTTMLWFSFVAYFITQKRIQVLYNSYQKVVLKSLGIILILVALKIALF